MSIEHSDNAIETLIEAAERHGAESDPDHEIGDLQDLLRAAWELMSQEQRRAFWAGSAAQAVIETN